MLSVTDNICKFLMEERPFKSNWFSYGELIILLEDKFGNSAYDFLWKIKYVDYRQFKYESDKFVWEVITSPAPSGSRGLLNKSDNGNLKVFRTKNK